MRAKKEHGEDEEGAGSGLAEGWGLSHHLPIGERIVRYCRVHSFGVAYFKYIQLYCTLFIAYMYVPTYLLWLGSARAS